MNSPGLNIHYFQHVPFEGPGCVAGWSQQRGHSLSSTRFYENSRLPDIASIDWLIVMGGPMGVSDEEEYPWLRQEKEFIRKAVENGKTVLGICLGAQLIAEALGAKVYPNPQKEIGWFPIRFTNEALKGRLFAGFPPELTVFHWHGDTFDLPENALPLACSDACENQGFIYNKGKVLALQFHFETTSLSLDEMLREGSVELKKAGRIQTAGEILSGSGFIPAANRHLDLLLDRLAGNE